MADGYEHERKFLVADKGVAVAATGSGAGMAQGYLDNRAGLSVRVRLVADRGHYTVTVKGPRSGMTRREAECAIDRDVAELLLDACDGHVVAKTRYPATGPDGKEWTVDVFQGANEGLVLAEVELAGEQDEVALPPWCGAEVTDDDRYYNEHLAHHPFSTWGTPADGGPQT